MRLRPNPRLPFFFVLASMGAACQLVNGIGDELTYEPGDGGVDATQEGATTTADAHNEADGALDAIADSEAGALDAIADSEAGALDADADASDCPVLGAAMVRITTVSGWSYCIDVTEVTRGQFAQYSMLGKPLGNAVPVECFDDAGGLNTPQTPTDNLQSPMSNVPFCYAADYCAHVGKRLCGKVGGGTLTSTGSSEWFYACANGTSLTAYPYGNTFDPNACVTDASAPADVGSHPNCHGTTAPFSQIFDMSGNLAEFDNTAWTGNPVSTFRGGAYSTTDNHSCAFADNAGIYSSAFAEVGFRCCADAR